MKFGLVMEGGGMRGVFTAGVLDELLREKIMIDGAVGVSAGAIFGTNIKSGQIGRVIRFNKRYCQDPRYVSLRSFLTTGDVFGADFCYRQLTYELDPFDYKKFAASPMVFYSVATNLESGRAFYHKWHSGLQEDMIWCRASASLPLFSRRVEIFNKSYLDGGVADPIPIRFFEHLGYDRNIIILTKPRNFVMKPSSLMAAVRIRYRKYPEFIRAFSMRHIIYNRTMHYIDELERKGTAIVISPSGIPAAGVIEKIPENLQKTYEDGIAQCRKVMNQIHEYNERKTTPELS